MLSTPMMGFSIAGQIVQVNVQIQLQANLKPVNHSDPL